MRYLSPLFALLGVVAAASADAAGDLLDAWQFNASVYLFLPTLDTTTAFPADSGGTSINISSQQILENIQSLFMGTFEVRKADWGVFTDVVYIDIGASRTQTRSFSISGVLPVGTTADLSYDITGSAWTTAGEYRIPPNHLLTMDVFVGTRRFDLKQALEWNIAGNLGTLNAANRLGSAEVSDIFWDAVLGIKGRYTFTAEKRWSIPFYLDIGAGDATLTWQGVAGVSYSFGWGEINTLWRYLSYQLPPGASISNFNFGGPQVGLTFRW
jgi:hypothetical protein